MAATVTVSENGREGRVQYSDGAHSLSGYWEFGGRDVVAIVSMGSRQEWQRAHPWALQQRAAILRFIAAEVVRQRAPSCTAEIDEASGDILLRQRGAALAAGAGTGKGTGAGAGAASTGVTGASVGGRTGTADLTITGARSRTENEARAAIFVRRLADLKARFGLGLLVIALVVGAVLWMGKALLYVAPATGVPLNDSVRTDTHIASLIQSTDPHLPEISGRGGNTTTSISVLLIPLDSTEPRVVPLGGQLPGQSYSLARILGSDGHTLWIDAAGLVGVHLSDYEIVMPKDLRKANPALDPGWWDDPRGMDLVDGALHVVRADRSAALAVEPLTWKAAPAKTNLRSSRFDKSQPTDLMAAGFLVAPFQVGPRQADPFQAGPRQAEPRQAGLRQAEPRQAGPHQAGPGAWFGVHAAEEIQTDFKPGQWVRPVAPVVDAKRPRRLYGGETEAPSEDGYWRIHGMTALGTTEFLNAAFLRLEDKAAPLRLASPDSVLMVFTSAPGPQGTLVVARVDLQGGILWTADTGLDRFQLRQILPGTDRFAFVGTRPPQPDQLSEPLVVLVDNHSGELTRHSLWR